MTAVEDLAQHALLLLPKQPKAMLEAVFWWWELAQHSRSLQDETLYKTVSYGCNWGDVFVRHRMVQVTTDETRQKFLLNLRAGGPMVSPQC